MEDWRKAKKLCKEKHCVAQTAPSMRTALGEAFGFKPGTIVAGKMVSCLKQLGFQKVFETDFGAELRVMEEAVEFAQRLKAGERLPLMTSCCPAWVRFCVTSFPSLEHLLSTCKSPQEMLGALAKSYYARRQGLKAVGVVAVMPCYSKKMEVRGGDTDVVLTARELAEWVDAEGVDFASLPDTPFDAPLGTSSSAGSIYGRTGGVSEATMRTFFYNETGKPFQGHFVSAKTPLEGVREASVKFKGKTLKLAIVQSIPATRRFCQALVDGEAKGYAMVEVMACPGGCVGGPGMPSAAPEAIRARIESLSQYDDFSSLKNAHDNPLVQEVYEKFLGYPGSPKAKKILHLKNFEEVFL